MHEDNKDQLRADLLTLTLFIDEVAAHEEWIADRIFSSFGKKTEVYEAMARALRNYEGPTWHSQPEAYHNAPECPKCGGTKTRLEAIDCDATPCDSDWHEYR